MSSTADRQELGLGVVAGVRVVAGHVQAKTLP
jgi:hypothetical protein